MEADKELVLEAQTKPRDLAVKTALSLWFDLRVPGFKVRLFDIGVPQTNWTLRAIRSKAARKMLSAGHLKCAVYRL